MTATTMTTTNVPGIRVKGRTDPARARAALARPAAFGQTLADLMVRVAHDEARGWHGAVITRLAPLSLSPAAKVLHYSQEIFEGHKAYAWPDGQVALFRPELNARRLNDSARAVGLPEVPVPLQLEAAERLVDLLRCWVPAAPDASLYLRPAIIGTDPSLGVGPSREHLYFVIASPVGPYFSDGAIAIQVEEERPRAVPGGLGAAKTGGNYAAGLAAQQDALARGYDQVLFLDARRRRYVEELNAMNVFVVEGERTLVTPPLGGTILPGITRRSILELAGELGLRAVERPLPVEDLVAGLASGEVSEIFAAGTAAVITSVGTLGYRGQRRLVGDGGAGPVAARLREAITGVQYGRTPDTHGWMRVVRSAGEVEPALVNAVG
jgi:branched-chain amino acid aminotransferase